MKVSLSIIWLSCRAMIKIKEKNKILVLNQAIEVQYLPINIKKEVSLKVNNK